MSDERNKGPNVLSFEDLLKKVLQVSRTVSLEATFLDASGENMVLAAAEWGSGPDHWSLTEFKVFFDFETMPRLNLRQAGVDLNQNPGQLRFAVNKLLEGRQFLARADQFKMDLEDYWMLPMDGLCLLAKINVATTRLPVWSPPTPAEKFYLDASGLSGSSLSLIQVGEPSPGLDLSKPVVGWSAIILETLVPKGSPERIALEACSAMHEAGAELGKEVNKRGDFWRNLWYVATHSKSYREKRLQLLRDKFGRAVNRYEEAVAVLS